MSRARVRGWIAGVVTAGVLVGAILSLGPAPQGDAKPQAAAPAQRVRAPGKPIPMTAGLIGLEIALGLKDEQPTPWNGEVQVSEGKVREVEIIQGGGPNAKVEGNRFTVRTI